MINSTPTDLEKRVIDACLAGDHPTLSILRHQAKGITVVDRRHTGVGAYIDFAVDDAAPRLDPGSVIIGDIDLEVAGVTDGVATLLYAYDGRLQFLEFATYDDEWPEDPTLLRIAYFKERSIGPTTFALDPVAERDRVTLERALTSRNAEPAK
ncbi:hypothetical protein LVB87_11505 [Lysobacter sp. KIS68-7]|uniref:hypothetical protein n=1 Tax=Lysobacter sp. KIS68-7 TaxID=2904252 RepID=UPI001E5C37B6|nr:hypothetical protein [Lysobacter sp. KIS68-7]UHQ18807.1 hypothetical protein LVB87_11505 [Lysobacter sp. KIS68-7]